MNTQIKLNPMKQKDLFGQITELPENGQLTKMQRHAITNNYRPAEGRERCKNCKYLRTMQYNKRYYKCECVGVTHSMATDIRVNHVCDLYEEAQ